MDHGSDGSRPSLSVTFADTLVAPVGLPAAATTSRRPSILVSRSPDSPDPPGPNNPPSPSETNELHRKTDSHDPAGGGSGVGVGVPPGPTVAGDRLSPGRHGQPPVIFGSSLGEVGMIQNWGMMSRRDHTSPSASTLVSPPPLPPSITVTHSAVSPSAPVSSLSSPLPSSSSSSSSGNRVGFVSDKGMGIAIPTTTNANTLFPSSFESSSSSSSASSVLLSTSTSSEQNDSAMLSSAAHRKSRRRATVLNLDICDDHTTKAIPKGIFRSSKEILTVYVNDESYMPFKECQETVLPCERYSVEAPQMFWTWALLFIGIVFPPAWIWNLYKYGRSEYVKQRRPALVSLLLFMLEVVVVVFYAGFHS